MRFIGAKPLGASPQFHKSLLVLETPSSFPDYPTPALTETLLFCFQSPANIELTLDLTGVALRAEGLLAQIRRYLRKLVESGLQVLSDLGGDHVGIG